ncbi:hypothetical protein HZS_2135 [Henneguya salminicola]|uniref:Farnesyl pyrophosphate synthase n=1 Tax=Henneguya salminicola TaxID=69463 RepID=A0A6G3MEX6_HENSL|nr:hypothetical protein HZS_2135 [Henneguya salminicola]
MVEYKTSFYTFVFPFLAAFYLSERKDLNQFIVIFVDTLKNFGLLFQIQDDYLDVFGDSQITGKIGTDIQDGKCTWLTVQLIDLMSDEHKKEFETHFGVNNTDSINLIKDLYIKYDLKELFQNTINKLIIDTIKVIDQISPEPFADYYKKFIQSLQSREK